MEYRTKQEIELERLRQEKKWGEQNHMDSIWYLILSEEMGEVAKAQLELHPKEIAKELIEVIAVGVAWSEAIKRRSYTTNVCSCTLCNSSKKGEV